MNDRRSPSPLHRRRHRRVALLAAAALVVSCSDSGSGSDNAAESTNGSSVTVVDTSSSDDTSPSLPPTGTDSAAGIGPRAQLVPDGTPIDGPIDGTPQPTNQWWSGLLEPTSGTTIWAMPVAVRMQNDGLAFDAGQRVRATADTVETLFVPELRIVTATGDTRVVEHGSHSVVFDVDIPATVAPKDDTSSGVRPDPLDNTFQIEMVDGTPQVVEVDNGQTAAPVDPSTARITVAQGSPFVHVTADRAIELYLQGGTAKTVRSGLPGHLEISSEHGVWDVTSATPVQFVMDGDRVIVTPEAGLDITLSARPLEPPLGWLEAVVDVTLHPLRTTESVITTDWQRGVVRQELRWVRDGAAEEGVVVAMPHQQATVVDAGPELGSYLVAQGPLAAIRGDTLTMETPLRAPLLALPTVDGSADLPSFDFEQILSSESVIAPTGGGSYYFGKQLARTASLAELAAATGDETSLNAALDIVAAGLLDVALKSGDDDPRYAVRDPERGGVLIVPSEFGNDRYNDHHFQYAYLIRAAATLMELDPEFAGSDAGTIITDLVQALIVDITGVGEGAPGVRVWNAYEGHSYATGIADSGAGPNQESSSEAAHAWESIARWAAVEGDQALLDSSLALWTLETESAVTYWLGGIDYLGDYAHTTTGIYWSAKLDFATFFDGRPEAAVGIQLLPFTMGSLYRSPAFTAVDPVAGLGNLGPDDLWFDLFVMERAISDPAGAAASVGDLNEIEPGNSLALVLYWIHLMDSLGRPSATIHAATPSAQAFEHDGQVLLVARNVGAEPMEAVFLDAAGTEVGRLTVPPRSTVTEPCTACG
jgi:endoglucanase Acf2